MRMLASIVLCAGVLAAAQESQPSPFAAGYDYPAPFLIAPGQLITLFAYGIPRETPFVRAPGNADLPISLGNISVGLLQLLTRFRAPMLEVRRYRSCSNPIDTACTAPVAAITVQVPFEINNRCEQVVGSGCGFSTDLSVQLNETVSFLIDAIAIPDQIRLLRKFDSLAPMGETGRAGQCGGGSRRPFNVTGLPCPALVTHKDGSLVSQQNPAKAGEVLTAYAVGMGQTSPASETGRVSRIASSTVTPYTLDFNFRSNALPTRPPPAGTPNVAMPLYAGTTPGYVGLYQVNFTVPPVPAATPACAELDPVLFPIENVVYSNLTVSIGGRFSFDGAGICVAVDGQ